MIDFIKGDAIQAFQDCNQDAILLHQEDCMSGMKCGFAKELYKHYPQAYRPIDMTDLFGSVFPILDVGKNKAIYSLYSQYHPGPPSKKLGRYSEFVIVDDASSRATALKKCLRVVARSVEQDVVIFMPLIASGSSRDPVFNYMSELGYFKKHINYLVDRALPNYTIKAYYLENSKQDRI